jgi:hypothetical protein
MDRHRWSSPSSSKRCGQQLNRCSGVRPVLLASKGNRRSRRGAAARKQTVRFRVGFGNGRRALIAPRKARKGRSGAGARSRKTVCEIAGRETLRVSRVCRGSTLRLPWGVLPGGRASIDLGRRRRTRVKVAPLGVCYSLSYACDDQGSRNSTRPLEGSGPPGSRSRV